MDKRNEMAIAESQDEKTLLDVLDREKFVNHMVEVTEMLSKQRKNACYAVNGSWGVGKSFVLDMFEKRIEVIQKPIVEGEPEECCLEKCIVFRYDCWKYDYYEEPIIAIVSNLLETIDKKVNLISNKTKSRVVEMMKKAGDGIVDIFSQCVRQCTHYDLRESIEYVRDNAEIRAEKEKEKIQFDTYRTFNTVLSDLREALRILTQERTVVYMVDELDRCLPEYTVKVLERLHHVFNGLPNVQMILAIDKEQLEHTIKNIYGEQTQAERYLAKFIDFEMKLDEGKFNAEYLTKFEAYLKHFSNVDFVKNENMTDFVWNIFRYIDMREREHIIQKCDMLHGLLPQDHLIENKIQMCIEVFLAVIQYYALDTESLCAHFNIGNIFEDGSKMQMERKTALYWINKNYQKGKYGKAYYKRCDVDRYGNIIYRIYILDVWGILLKVYRCILGFDEDLVERTQNIDLETVSALIEYAKKFWNLMQIIA